MLFFTQPENVPLPNSSLGMLLIYSALPVIIRSKKALCALTDAQTDMVHIFLFHAAAVESKKNTHQNNSQITNRGTLAVTLMPAASPRAPSLRCPVSAPAPSSQAAPSFPCSPRIATPPVEKPSGPNPNPTQTARCCTVLVHTYAYHTRHRSS